MATQPLANDGLETIRLFSRDLEVSLLPTLGGKIHSIRWYGHELLAHNPRKPLRPARYAAPYAEFDASGFDECLPTIGACGYPQYPWQGTPLPDHGEVWSLPWEIQAQPDCVHLSVTGVRVPYRFEKWIDLPEPGQVRFRYTLTNLTPFPFRYLWSAHPLLAPQPGMRICLPPGVRVRVDWSRDGRLGGLLAEHAWPHTLDSSGNPVDLSRVLAPEAGLVDKLYTCRLPEGWCAVHNPAQNLYAGFVFSPHQIPYVGLSINLGGWPVDEPAYYNLGLEPCSGYPDRLDLAVERGDCPTLAPRAARAWEMRFVVGPCRDAGQVSPAFTRLSRELYPS